MRMKPVPDPRQVRTTEGYDDLLKTMYLGAKRRIEEVLLPPVSLIRVEGNQPPGSEQYAQAVAVLFGLGYTLKMGLKGGQLPRPAGYFDYKVGALETLWWSLGRVLDTRDPETLRWRAQLMVPAFVTRKLFNEARRLARTKHPEIPYRLAKLVTFHEGPCVQTLHVGPWDQELPTIEALHAYVDGHGLAVSGKHHEIYLSDPRRTAPEKLRTVVRVPVKTRPKRIMRVGGAEAARRSSRA
jgi:hypothetical protein